MDKPVAVIVEDDPMLGQILCKTLEADFTIEWFTHGGEALARLEASPTVTTPRLVVLDINLPGDSGLKIYDRLKNRNRMEPALANVRVIICSADSQATDYLSDDVALTLLKPVSPIQLRTLATRILSENL